MQCWLESINPLLPPKQRLWIPDASSFAYLCCAYRNGEWHACGTLELLQGADAKSAKPWVVPALLKVDGANKKVPVPIRIEASWTCMAEDEHGPHAASGPKPFRSGRPAPIR